MSEKNFLKHFIVIGSGTLVNMVLSVFTTPIITRCVAPVDYGKFSVFTMYSNMALMILGLGLDQALVRYYYEEDDVAYKRGLLLRCIKWPILASIIVSTIITGMSISGKIKFEFNTGILIILCLYTIIQIIYRFSLLLIRLSYRSKLYSTLNIINKLLYILIALPLIIFICQNDLISLIIAITIAAFVCLLISVIAEKEIWNLRKYQINNCCITNRELVKYAYPFIFSMGITSLFQTIDKISLNMYRSYEEVGIYSSAMTLVNIFAIIQTTFNSLWGPMAIEHYTKKGQDKIFYQKGNQVITVIMFFIGISLILCKDVFAILLGEKYREAAYILHFLIFNPIMYTISETTVIGLVFMKKSKLQVIVASGVCLVNIIGNTILVPEYGGKGAAISTGISYIIFFTLRTIMSNHYYYVDYKLKNFYILTFIVMLYAFYNTFTKFNIGTIIGYVLCLLLLLTLYRDTIKIGVQYIIKTC